LLDQHRVLIIQATVLSPCAHRSVRSDAAPRTRVDAADVMLHALDQLEEHSFAFPDRRITVLATEECAALGDRIVARIGQAASTRAILEHP
jgi:hypothetical protein